MTVHGKLLLLALAASAATAWCQAVKKGPHIGYLYPAGGQRGTVVQIVAGGQFLRGASEVYISGEGVRASVIECYRPIRNLQKEQRDELVRRLTALKEKRLAELPADDKARAIVFPGERPAWKGKRKGKGKGKAADVDTAEPPRAEPVELPSHPSLRDLEKKSLRELLHVANEFLNFRTSGKKQQNAQIAESVLLEVTVDPDAQPGDRELRLKTPLGLTTPLCFQVGQLPEVNEQEPNDPKVIDRLPTVPPIDSPVLLNGQIMPGDVDRFRLRAQQGQQLVIRAHARRLVPFLADAVPGWFQATLALYDADGNEVAFADDYRFDPDPVLFYEIPGDGEFELEIRDSIYRGREDFVYRIAVGELPFITSAFPLGGQAGVKTVASIDGWNLARKRLRLDTRPGGDRIRHAVLRQNGQQSNEVVYAVDTLPEGRETEPNNDTADAQRVHLPQLINGCIARPGDVDVFQFDGRAGDELALEVLARRLRSPLDSLLRLTDASGRVLAWNDDYMLKQEHLHKGMGLLTHHADSYLLTRLPEDGTYYVHLADAQEHGGESYAYRLRITRARFDFVLLMSPSCVTLPATGAAPLTVHALRQDGFDGTIELSLKNAPAGYVLSGGRIPSGRDHIRITLAGPTEANAEPTALQLEGRALIDGEAVVRPVVPCDDVMQAFLWRHLAPSKQFMVAFPKGKWRAPAVELAGPVPVQIPMDGVAEVQVKDARSRAFRNIELELSEPPEGVSIQNVRNVPGGLTFELKVEGDAAKAGLADNLIIEAFGESTWQKKGKQGAKATTKPRRVSFGVLPAIPFEVVQK